jgi:hypothetical protein
VALAVQQLPATSRTVSASAAIAIYWHLFSLDAPSVAALWSWSFARAAHITLPPLAPLLLATGTWLVYIADRLLDGMNCDNYAYLRVRHHFYARHRQTFLLAGFAVCPLFLWVVFTQMAPIARREDLAVFAVATLYFLLIHARGRRIERWLPKELAVGILFAAATAVPAWARLSGHRMAIVPAIILFALLCCLNCVCIENWERGRRTEHPAHASTIWAGTQLQTLATGTALLALILSLTALNDPPLFCLFLASAAAALLLLWLARNEHRLSAMQLRIAADAALLTPLLFLAWLR